MAFSGLVILLFFQPTRLVSSQCGLTTVTKIKTSMSLFVERDHASRFCCPTCEYSSLQLQTVRKHAWRTHSQRATVKKEPTSEERRVRQREYERAYRQRKTAKASTAGSLAATEVRQERPTFMTQDADTRGIEGAADPIVRYDKSLLENAGNGVFGVVALEADDIVTSHVVSEAPVDPAYSVELPGRGKPTYLKCIELPVKGKGLGSFVNREVRKQGFQKKLYYCQSGQALLHPGNQANPCRW